MNKKTLLAVCIVTGALFAATARADSKPSDEPEWIEGKIPPPPTFTTDKLIPIDMPRYVSVKVGVDPGSVSVGVDGVVRYVVVMTNASGSINATYEGIHCVTDEVKTYARWSSSGSWSMIANPQWIGVNENMPSKHAMAIARQGACIDHLTSGKDDTLRALRGQKSSLITN